MTERASSFIDEAAGDGAQLVVLPEFWSTGYFPLAVDYSLYDLADSEDGKATTAVKEKARQHGVHIASTIYERQAAGLFYNTSMMVNPEGEIISKYRKVHVPARRGLEKLFYRGGSKFPVARVGEWQVGTMLCYDTLLPEPARCLALNGAELILAPFGASTTEGGIWEHMIITRAFENGAYVAALQRRRRFGIARWGWFHSGRQEHHRRPRRRHRGRGRRGWRDDCLRRSGARSGQRGPHPLFHVAGSPTRCLSCNHDGHGGYLSIETAPE